MKRPAAVLFLLPWLTGVNLPVASAEDAPRSASAPVATPTADETAPAPATDAPALRVVWQNDPLVVPLKVGVKRRIDFAEPIADLDVPHAVERQSQIVLTPTGQLLWTARAPFPAARVLATSVSGTLYQLDVQAHAEGAPPPQLIVGDPLFEAAAPPLGDRAQREAVAAALIPDFLKGDGSAGRGGEPSHAALARFVLAHYQGPARLIPALDASPVPVQPIATHAWVRVQSAALAVRPLKQWKIGARYVTALGVDNRSARPIAFDPRALRGDLVFAATLHPTLEPVGSGHQGTVWAVVTDQPFNRAVTAHGFR